MVGLGDPRGVYISWPDMTRDYNGRQKRTIVSTVVSEDDAAINLDEESFVLLMDEEAVDAKECLCVQPAHQTTPPALNSRPMGCHHR